MRAAGNVAAMRRAIAPTAWSPWGSYDVGQREGGDSDQDCTLGFRRDIAWRKHLQQKKVEKPATIAACCLKSSPPIQFYRKNNN